MTKIFSFLEGLLDTIADPDSIGAGARSYLAWMDRTQKIRIKIVMALFVIQTLAVAGYLGHFLLHTQPYLPSAMVEQVLEDTGARNFIERGFAKNLFLVDYSSSPNDQDHPYLYTHMPSGPAVLLGVLKMAGATILQCRAVFATIALLGCIFLFLFTLQVSGIPEIALLTYVMFTLDYAGAIKYSDHFVHSFGNLSFFGTLYFYFRYLNQGGRSNLLALVGLFTISLLTSFLSCIPLAVAILLLHFFFFKNSIRGRTILFTAFFTGLFWAALHFGRNCLVLGADIAFKDFFFTVTNRVAAWPSKEELSSFFVENKIVLWGVGKVLNENLNNWLVDAILSPILNYQVAVVVIGILLFSLGLDWRKPARICGIVLVVFASTYAWHIIFYAQGTNYIFPPNFRMFRVGASIIGMVAIAHGLRHLSEFAALHRERFRPVAVLSFLMVGFASLMFLIPFISHTRHENKLLVRAARAGYEPEALVSYQRLERVTDGTIITNIDALMLNFFVKNLTFGGCDKKAVENLNVYGCPSSFVNESTKKAASPRYVFLNREFVPGYQTCFGDCLFDLESQLRKKYTVIDEEAEKWILFELNGVSTN